MSASKKDVVDFDFIFNEIIRLEKLYKVSSESFFNDFDGVYGIFGASVDAPLFLIKRSKGKHFNSFYLSSAAQLRLWEITYRKIKENNLELIMSESELLLEIKDSLYIHFINNQNRDVSGYSKLLARGLKSANRKMGEIDYYLPFNAPGISRSLELSFGRVKLAHKDRLYNKIFENKRIDEFREKSGDFNAFLCMKISDCSGDIRIKRANNVANLIFGILQVYGSKSEDIKKYISLNSNPSLVTDRSYIVCNMQEYHLCDSFSSSTDLEIFWENISKELDTELGNILIKLVNYTLSPIKKECVADRLIDAIYWFGDASRDNNQSSQIIKLTTSLERLVTLSIDKKDYELTDRFCNRLSCLISGFHGEVNVWKSYAKELYSYRSKLVHGSQSHHKASDSVLSFDPFVFTSYAIFSSCIVFNQIGLERSKQYEAELLKLFNYLDKDGSSML